MSVLVFEVRVDLDTHEGPIGQRVQDAAAAVGFALQSHHDLAGRFDVDALGIDAPSYEEMRKQHLAMRKQHLAMTKERDGLIARLTERAEWLRREYLNGGKTEDHERECLHILAFKIVLLTTSGGA
jgi:hypothetical protein